MCLYDKLISMGFKVYTKHPTKFEKILNIVKKDKYKIETYTDWLIKKIDNKMYELYFDMYYVDLLIDGEIVLSIGKRDNDELVLKMVPNDRRDKLKTILTYAYNKGSL